jgi:adenylosuccinate lyase
MFIITLLHCGYQIHCAQTARYVMNLPPMAAQTHAGQWFERTLDDSAIRRIILPEAFLATDVIITTLHNISDGMHVWPKVHSKLHIVNNHL